MAPLDAFMLGQHKMLRLTRFTVTLHMAHETLLFQRSQTYLRSTMPPLLQGSGQTRTREIQRRELAEPNRTLFVVNFQPDTTHLDDLRQFFSQWGELERVQLKTKFAFVQVRPVPPYD